MTATFEKTGQNTGTLTFSIDQQKQAKGLDIAFKKIKKNLTAPGFRKGHVPRAMFNRLYGEEALYEEAINAILQEVYIEAVAKANIAPVGQPKFDIEKIKKGEDWLLKAEVAVKPEVKLGQYKKLEIEKESAEISDKDIDETIEKEREKLAEWVVKEEASASGDTVVIDFTGTIDGEKFDGGTSENYSLVLGSNSFIPGFEDQLVGHKEGDKVQVKVTFPKDYANSDLANKDALFDVKIHEVKAKEIPELNDEFAKDVDDDVNTLEELKTKIREDLEKGRAEEVEDIFEEAAVHKAVENAEIGEIPQEMIDEDVKRSIALFFSNLRQQGITPEMYYNFSGTNEESLHKKYEKDADFRVRTNLVIEKIAEEEKITVTKEEIKEELTDLTKQYNLTEKQVKDSVSEDMLEHDIKMKKAILIVTDSAIAKNSKN